MNRIGGVIGSCVEAASPPSPCSSQALPWHNKHEGCRQQMLESLPLGAGIGKRKGHCVHEGWRGTGAAAIGSSKAGSKNKFVRDLTRSGWGGLSAGRVGRACKGAMGRVFEDGYDVR